MKDCLRDLDAYLRQQNSKLFVFKGEPVRVLAQIYAKVNFAALGFNLDYSRYSMARDGAIKKFCKDREVEFVGFEDD